MPDDSPVILHLLDAAGEAREATPARLALLAHGIHVTPQYEHRVLLLGPAWMQQAAAEMGLAPITSRQQVPFHHPAFAYRTLRAMLDERRRPDLIHAWSQASARVTRLAPACRGIPVCRFEPGGPTLIPTVDADRVVGSTRHALRSRWGVGDHVRLIALLSDGTGLSPAMAGALAVGLARECLRDQSGASAEVALLIHPKARGLSRVLDMMGQLNWRGGLIQDAALARPWHSLPACDVALTLGPSLLSEPLWAAAAHVPIIAERGGPVTDRLAEAGGAVRVDPDTARQAGYQIVELIRDPARARAMTDAAAATLHDQFSDEALAGSLHALYAPLTRTVAGAASA